MGRAYWISLVADLLFGLLNVAIYYFISETVGRPSDGSLGGAPTFFAFAAVGVAIVSVIGSASVGLARRVREEQLTGTLEAVVIQPLSATELAVGLAGYPFLLAVARAAVYIVSADVIIGLGVDGRRLARVFARAACLGRGARGHRRGHGGDRARGQAR